MTQVLFLETGNKVETVDGDVFTVLNLDIAYNPNIVGGTAVVVTDIKLNKHHFSPYEEVEILPSYK